MAGMRRPTSRTVFAGKLRPRSTRSSNTHKFAIRHSILNGPAIARPVVYIQEYSGVGGRRVFRGDGQRERM